jgi:tight adherence protein B
MAALGLPNLVLSRLRMRRINKFVDIFPNALDIIVRGVKAGLPLGDTLRIIANESPEPVRSEFRKLVEAQALGLPLPEAAEKLAERVPISETNFFSIVIGIQSKSGGNLSEAIGNLSRTLRERKKMKGKIKSMAMEAKASAAIIGAVPFVVTTLLYLSSPKYISLLWMTQHGRIVAAIACFWMSIGVVMMRKMISFDF